MVCRGRDQNTLILLPSAPPAANNAPEQEAVSHRHCHARTRSDHRNHFWFSERHASRDARSICSMRKAIPRSSGPNRHLPCANTIGLNAWIELLPRLFLIEGTPRSPTTVYAKWEYRAYRSVLPSAALCLAAWSGPPIGPFVPSSERRVVPAAKRRTITD